MDSNWKEIKALLDELFPLDKNGREARLSHSDISDEVRSEVQSLLAVEDEASKLMNAPAIEFSTSFLTEDEIQTTFVGKKIGIYKIVREIDDGGMGAVYLATRDDGKFEQRVAIKLLRRELNTPGLRRRFEQERRILASLEHKNIARLLDAGTTDDGVPYFVMEYVEGSAIDQFCDENELDLNERLDLFRKVCEAVNFAHRNLIVHRDLKPSNILVSQEGSPKLLDFGISKIISDEFEQTATVTRLGAMTPSYASPEQLQNKSVTTATDIYSLGVVLYKLLSGHRPFEARENDLNAIYQAVVEIDPPAPSLMIGESSQFDEPRSAVGHESATGDTASNRSGRTFSNRLPIQAQQLKGDLDNIILKALKKEPERRYSSAENFAEDIHRYQRGLTVSARPDVFSYRFAKFIRRNSFAVGAAVLLVVAVFVGVVTTLWQASVARAERIKAENRFNDVRALANSFLFEFSPKIENLPGSLPARQLLVMRALEYLDNLSQEADEDIFLQNELAKAYEKIGDVQGNPQTPNIGDLKSALTSYEKAQTIRRKLLETEPAAAEKQADLAGNLEVTANIHLNGGDFDKAEAGFNEAVALREKILSLNSANYAARSNLAYSVRLQSYVPYYNNQNEKALEISRRSLMMFAELSREFPDDAFVNMQYANLNLDIGEGLTYVNEMTQGQEYVQRGLALLIALHEKHPNDDRVRRALFVASLKRGELYRTTGDAEKSLVNYDRALTLAQAGLRDNPGSFQAKRDVYLASKNRGITLKASELFKESIESFSRAVDICDQLKRDDPNNTIISYDTGSLYHDMSELYFLLKDFSSALTFAQKAQDNLQEVLTKMPEHTRSKSVTALSKNLVGKIYNRLAEKNNDDDLWQKTLINYRASLEIYNQLKTDGKFTPLDEKRVTDVKAAIAKVESKLGIS